MPETSMREQVALLSVDRCAVTTPHRPHKTWDWPARWCPGATPVDTTAEAAAIRSSEES